MLFARARRPASPAWSRSAVEPELLREYDAFGPWIYAVHGPQELPRRFRPAWERHAGARFLLKLPAFVDRGQARPGQDLYRALLAVHDERVDLLTHDGERILEASAPVASIVAITDFTCLLQGELLLRLAGGGTLTVAYSTVSHELIERVIDFLRARIAPPAPVPPPASSLSTRDHLFRHLCAEHARRSPHSALLYCEERRRRFRDAAGRHLIAPGLLALDTGSELTLAARSEFAYALARTHVPHSAIVGHALEEQPVSWLRARRELRLYVPGHTLPCELCGDGGALLPLLARLGRDRSTTTGTVR